MPQLNEVKKGREIGYTGLTSYFIWHACIDCGKQRWTGFSIKKKQARRLRCPSCGQKAFAKSQPCAQRRRENSPNWKGGRKQFDRYIHIYLAPDDFFYSMADKQGYVREHRLVMAKHLGRCLHSWELVHHKNHIRDDNRIENLQLVSSERHQQITILENEISHLKKRVTLLEADNTLLREQVRQALILAANEPRAYPHPKARRIVE